MAQSVSSDPYLALNEGELDPYLSLNAKEKPSVYTAANLVRGLKAAPGFILSRLRDPAARERGKQAFEDSMSAPAPIQALSKANEQAVLDAPAGSVEEKLAKAGLFASEFVGPLTSSANVVTIGAGGIAPLAAAAPKIAAAARGTSMALNTALAIPAAEQAGALAGEASVDPDPGNIGAALGFAALAILGGVGAYREILSRDPPVFRKDATEALNRKALEVARADAAKLARAAEAEAGAKNMRAADFLKAKAELHAQAVAELEAALAQNQIGTGETTVLAGTPAKNRLDILDTRPGNAARERARLTESQIAVDEGGIPRGVTPSAQAARVIDEQGFTAEAPSGAPVIRPPALADAKARLDALRMQWDAPVPENLPSAAIAEARQLKQEFERRFADVSSAFNEADALNKSPKALADLNAKMADLQKWSQSHRLARAEEALQIAKSKVAGAPEETTFTGEVARDQSTLLDTRVGEGGAQRERARLASQRGEALAVNDGGIPPNTVLSRQAQDIAAAEGEALPLARPKKRTAPLKALSDLPPIEEKPVVAPLAAAPEIKPLAEPAVSKIHERMSVRVMDEQEIGGYSHLSEVDPASLHGLESAPTEKPPVKAAPEGQPPSSETRPDSVSAQADETVPPSKSASNREIADQKRRIRDMDRQALKLDDINPTRASAVRAEIETERLKLAGMIERHEPGPTPVVGVDPNGNRDILTDIAEHVGTLRTSGDSESKARLNVLQGIARRLRGGENGAEWTDAVEILNGAGSRTMTERGAYNFRSPAELDDAISNAIAAREKTRASLKVEDYHRRVETGFIAETDKSEALLASKKGRLIEEIGVGGQFKIDGEKFSIVGVEETANGTYEYIVKDGHMFRVPEGTVVVPDKGKVTRTRPLSKQKDVDFLPEGEVVAPIAKTGVDDVWNAAKATPDEFTGVDATHLTAAERSELAQRGLSFHEGRNRQIIATYPQRLRVEDLKARVSEKRAPESFSLSSATNEQQAAEAAANRERLIAQGRKDKMDALAGKPLVGDSSDVGQGTILAGDEDLFSGPSAETLAKKKPSERGGIDPRLILSTPAQTVLGGVAGATYGGSKGNTPEERRDNALKFGALGMGVGGGGRILSRGILNRPKGPRVPVDEILKAPPGESMADVLRSAPNKARERATTVFAPLDQLQPYIARANAAILSLVPRSVLLSQEFEAIAGSSGRAAHDVQHLLLLPVVNAVGPAGIENFERIVTLRRIGNYMDQGLPFPDANGVPYTAPRVQTELDQIKGLIGQKEFDRLTKIAEGQLQDAANSGLQLQVTSGRLSGEGYDQIRARNDFYSPFRILEYAGDEGGFNGGRAIDTAEQLAKVRTGTENASHLENPIMAMGGHLWSARMLADKNRVMLSLAAMADTDVSGTVISRLSGEQQPRRGYEAVNYFEDGVQRRLEVRPDVARAVRQLNVVEAGILENTARAAAAPTRAGATVLNLAFNVGNFLAADQPTLLLASRYGINAKDLVNPFRIPLDLAHGAYASMFTNLLGGEGGAFQRATAGVPLLNKANDAAAKLASEFYASGAANSNWQAMAETVGGGVRDRASVAKVINPKNITALEAAGNLNKFIEETTKMMGFKRGIRIEGLKRMTPAQQEEAIKKVVAEVRNFAGSPDFFRGGTWTKTANNVLQLFLNARVQGVSNILGRAGGADGAAAARDLWVRGAAVIGIPAAYLWHLNHKPENIADYKKRSERERQDYFVIPRYDDAGKPLYSRNDRGEMIREYFSFQKRELGQYIGNTVEAALDFANTKNPDAVKAFAGHMLESISPLNVQGRNATERLESVVGGSILAAPYGVVSGRDAFRHRDIVDDYMQDRSPGKQKTETTPKLFVDAARAFPEGAPDFLKSPLRLQHLVEGLGGRALTQFVAKPQPEGRDPLAAKLAGNPLTSRFVRPLIVDRTEERDRIELEKRRSADISADRESEAKATVKRMRTMDAATIEQELATLHARDPKASETLVREIVRQTKDPSDRWVRSLNVEDGARARFIAWRASEMTPAETVEYLQRLYRGPQPALTPRVLEQLDYLRKNPAQRN